MMMYLDNASGIPLYEQIYTYYREMIFNGSIEPGFRLPSIRALASDLCVSKNTVIMAYDRLVSEGYIANKQRSGFVVEHIGADALLDVPIPSVGELSDVEMRQGWLRSRNRLENNTSYEIDFKYGSFDSRLFPLDSWRKIANDVLLSDETAKRMSVYGDPQGEVSLREEICKYLHRSRGVNCVPEQVVIDGVSQTTLTKLLLLFDREKHTVAIDDPVYNGLMDAAQNLGFRVYPIPVMGENKEGAYLEALKQSMPKLVFVIPSHQFPTGKIMPLSLRVQLIAWAVRNDAYILEDDYASEYRYHSRPTPSLQSIDKWERVIYMGMFSKSFSPALRISYLVLPPKLLHRYHRYLDGHYCSVPWFEQEVMARFMKQGLWDKHLRRVVTTTRKKHDLLVEEIERQLGSAFRVFGKNGGVHLLLRSTTGMSQQELIERAAGKGVKVYSDERYWCDRSHMMGGALILGYQSLSEEDIMRGVNLLAQAWLK